MVLVVRRDKEFYIDERLQKSLDKIGERVEQKDEDYFWVVDGEEGGGKSVFTFQLAKYVDPSFDLSRVVFNAKDFKEAILKAKKGQAVVFDEAFRGLSSRGALTEVNKVLVQLMMECRQKNLFVFVVLPTFFLLEKYVALWRAKGLFHVYKKNGKRGYWLYFNKKKKKLLYLKGHATYSYKSPKTNFHGVFFNHYAINEEKYRQKKKDALQNSGKEVKNESEIEYRNFLLWYMVRELGVGASDLSRNFENFGFKLAQSTISEIVTKKDDELRKRGLLL